MYSMIDQEDCTHSYITDFTENTFNYFNKPQHPFDDNLIGFKFNNQIKNEQNFENYNDFDTESDHVKEK